MQKLNEHTTRQETKMYTLEKFTAIYTPKMLSNARELLNDRVIVNLGKGDRGCYDAEVHEGKEIYFVEVTMDSYKRLEDFYCTCNTGFCEHLSAVLWQVAEQNKRSLPTIGRMNNP